MAPEGPAPAAPTTAAVRLLKARAQVQRDDDPPLRCALLGGDLPLPVLLLPLLLLLLPHVASPGGHWA